MSNSYQNSKLSEIIPKIRTNYSNLSYDCLRSIHSVITLFKHFMQILTYIQTVKSFLNLLNKTTKILSRLESMSKNTTITESLMLP